MKQVFVIHGGDTFVSYERYIESLKTIPVKLETLEHRGWKRNLREALGADFEVALPHMPNAENVRYNEWKIWFERHIPLLHDGVILIGHSLGAIFLVKYLSENDFPKRIAATLLIAAPFEATDENNLLQFVLPATLEKFAVQGGKIFLYHSKDDTIVRFEELAKYQNALPQASARIFDDRFHFFSQEHFPELVADIRAL